MKESCINGLYDRLIEKKEKLAVVGLGYVGLPIAVEFAKYVNVIGFNRSEKRIRQYEMGIDVTDEVGGEAILQSGIDFTTDEKRLAEAKFIIAAVPTPVNPDNTPNLDPVISASRIIGRNMTEGTVVVYESTVYPGVTEEICIPILESESGMKCGENFKVGYSPERINPGDREHRFSNICKIVSGADEESLELIAGVYGLAVKAGIYKAESIKVAEAAKVIENSQRDINIAFMNELSVIFNTMGIDTQSVLKAAGTKWNFLNFTPGLVGGHCIGVDPYYLTYKAEQLGYHSQVILAGRRINDSMGKYIAENCVKSLVKCGKQPNGAKVAILGITFKENCPDIRNSKVFDIIDELKEYGIVPVITDPIASSEDVEQEYGVRIGKIEEIEEVDAVIIAVSNREYCSLTVQDIDGFFGTGKKILLDVKGIFDRGEFENAGYCYWRL